MSYTINPNAKNGWVRNAENTIDLSIETDASSVYLDNGRTLEQELGEGSMVSNVVTVDSAMNKVIDGTLDGAYESLIFKGQTLVNLSEQKTMTITSTTSDYAWYNTQVKLNSNLFKAGQKYLFTSKYSYTNKTFDNKTPIYFILRKNGETTEKTFLQTAGKGIFTIPTNFETTDTLYMRVHASVGTAIDNTVTCDDIKILEYQEGMENWDIPYFEGLCDVKMPILRNTGKNLFDINGDINQKFSYMAGGSGNVILGANSFRADSYSYDHHGKGVILNLKPNTTYTISGYVENFGNVSFMTGEWNPRHRVVKANGYFETTYTPADNEVETCISFVTFSTSSDPKAIFSNIQLEESSTPTTYEDYKTNILHTPETVTLRSLPNGVRDELNLNTGEYVQRIGEIVLNGESNLLAQSCEDVQYYRVGTGTINNFKLNSCIINDMLPVAKKVTSETKGEFIGDHINSQSIHIRLLSSKLSQRSVDGVQEYLRANPITVQYELETPITATIEPLSIPFAYENGHIVLESGFEGQSLLPTLEYSTVINRTGQIQSIANTVQKQEKQITKLEQMLIQNIIDLDYNNTLLTLKNEMEEML